MKQAEGASSLFKIAINCDPKEEQFWIRYADLLVKKHSFLMVDFWLKKGRSLI